jgi:hypothetical protein
MIGSGVKSLDTRIGSATLVAGAPGLHLIAFSYKFDTGKGNKWINFSAFFCTFSTVLCTVYGTVRYRYSPVQRAKPFCIGTSFTIFIVPQLH